MTCALDPGYSGDMGAIEVLLIILVVYYIIDLFHFVIYQ